MQSRDTMSAAAGQAHGGLRATRGDQGHSTLAGEADATSIVELRAALDQALVDGGAVISLDLAKLSLIDAAALSELLHYQLLALSRNQELPRRERVRCSRRGARSLRSSPHPHATAEQRPVLTIIRCSLGGGR